MLFSCRCNGETPSRKQMIYSNCTKTPAVLPVAMPRHSELSARIIKRSKKARPPLPLVFLQVAVLPLAPGPLVRTRSEVPLAAAESCCVGLSKGRQ